MKVVQGLSFDAATFRRPKVTLGTFDGVHVGHQRVIRELIAWSRSTDCEAAVLTFHQKPARVLAGRPFDQITSLRHRLRLFEELGVDAAIVLQFDAALASMEPEEFVRSFLVGHLHVSGVLLGHDTRFGRAGRGDVELMTHLGRQYDFEVCSAEVVPLLGRPVSSTRVREAIRDGDLPLAQRLLGRPVSLLGAVAHGTARGRKFGYPTANLELQHEVRPPMGVYATRVRIGGVAPKSEYLAISRAPDFSPWHDAVTNIGRPPTLEKTGPRYQSTEVIVETHILDYSGDLYGREIELQFVQRLRDEAKFSSSGALAEQIAKDVNAAREILSARAASEKNA